MWWHLLLMLLLLLVLLVVRLLAAIHLTLLTGNFASELARVVHLRLRGLLLLLHLLLMLHPLRGGDRCSVSRSHLLVRRGLPSAGGPTIASR